MCWSCNPYCGGCKPPKERPVKCLVCHSLTFRDSTNLCKKCGAILPAPTPRPTVMCLYIGKMCSNPCNRHKALPKDGNETTCQWHTPPKNNRPEQPPNV
ncbi:hypothetical protein Ga0466249_003464 [Sporomusaceae bacterium BoRhaA]|uniref:hypothetical protein n=1 Tax=Pelorhabdus rhamnosifermentans TaxID=2772457 RepID=UPI001C06274A|nr:hypothetical protein [Pelorhabdus rhamnosifermentans]MBU2702337.1 hypothetical protein [Pelorhabdus rhamnosifermentans]